MAINPITAGLSLVSDVVNKVWPDKTEQEKAQMAAAVALLQGQMEINKVEAASPNVFTSGWRPAIGWVCGLAMAYTYIGYPLLLWATAVWWPGVKPPVLVTDGVLTELLCALLGMSSLRTYEKTRGVT
jgi:Zn-dependent protease with chaperone function